MIVVSLNKVLLGSDIMSWEEELIELDDNIWNKLHVQKYLNGKFGDGTWKQDTRKLIETYTWEGNDLIIKIQKPTIKQGIIRIFKEGQNPIIKSVWNLKELKDLI